MYKSARILGQEVGLNSQEMNQLMYNQGFLEGVPGDYEITEKCLRYSKQKDFHRGAGGYPSYNRAWTEKIYDDSILNVLDLSTEEKSKARNQVKLRRMEHLRIRKEQQAEADRRFLEASNNIVSSSKEKFELPKGVKVALITGAVIAVGYGIYRIPTVNKWIKSKVIPFFKKDNKLYKNMICPKCGKNLILSSNEWSCTKCNFKIEDARIKDGEVFCFCAECNNLLNEQNNYTATNGVWTCTKCGCNNEVPININND